MTSEDAIFFLNKQKSDLYYTIQDFDFDTESVSYVQVPTFPLYQFKYIGHKYIIIGYSEEKSPDNDTSLVFISTFSLEGKIIDKCIVGDKFTREDDWMSFVLLDEHKFRVYYYEFNKEYTLKSLTENQHILPTIVYYIDYLIDENGRFIKGEHSPSQYLKELLEE